MRDLDALFAAFEVEVSTEIAVPPQAVWELVTDVTRIREFSPEVISAQWLDGGPQGPVEGARFAGTNRIGAFEWTRVCTVVDAVEPCVFAWVVGDRFDGSPSGRWAFEITGDGPGSVLTQRFTHARRGRSGTRLLADQEPDKAEEIIETRAQVLRRGMTQTLGSIKRVLERG